MNCVNYNNEKEEKQNKRKEEDETVVMENRKELLDKQIRQRGKREKVGKMQEGENYGRKYENGEREKEEEAEEEIKNEKGKERDTSKDSDTNESITTYENPWKLINPLLLINLYLNNPLTILSNAFLSLDNLKLLIITLSIYFAVKRIDTYSHKIYSFFNLLTILLLNAVLIYISTFHFILPIIGINYFIIYLTDDINTYHIKKGVHFWKIFRILVKNSILLIATLMLYVALLLVSAHFNGNSFFFLNNTVINEYRIMYVLPNLGNFWYIFSLMFENVYSSYLFLFHFHIFLYAIPLMFRLMKTPLIYLQILEVIALLFHPNVTVNDMIFAMLLLSIDYKNTMSSTPLSKLMILFLCHIGLYFVTVNLWLRKNTGNANYVFFNQIIVFNVAVIIANNSLKRFIHLQTPEEQLLDAQCIHVSEESAQRNPLSNFMKRIFS